MCFNLISHQAPNIILTAMIFRLKIGKEFSLIANRISYFSLMDEIYQSIRLPPPVAYLSWFLKVSIYCFFFQALQQNSREKKRAKLRWERKVAMYMKALVLLLLSSWSTIHENRIMPQTSYCLLQVFCYNLIQEI